MKNRILRAGVSSTALGLLSLGACLGNSSSSTSDDAGSAAQSTSGDDGSSGASPTSTGTTSPTGTGTTGTPPAGDSAAPSGGGTGVALTPDPNGYLGPSSNSLGIQGAWYGYGDDWGTNGAPPGDCESKGMHTASTCSSITFPPAATASDAGDGGFTSSFTQATAGTMCLSGTAAKVLGSDYTNMFGIGIGLDFNNQGGVKMPYNATANKVTGFSFNLTGVPSSGVRIELPIPATDSSGDAWAFTAMKDGPVQIDLTTMTSDSHALKESFMPTSGTEPPFDATKVESIQFHVPTNINAAVTVTMMCVSNFQAIVSQ